MQINVNVKLGSWFCKYYNGLKELDFTIDENTNLAGFLTLLDRIPKDEIGMVAINGVKQNFEFILKNNDEIKIFPIIIGG